MTHNYAILILTALCFLQAGYLLARYVDYTRSGIPCMTQEVLDDIKNGKYND